MLLALLVPLAYHISMEARVLIGVGSRAVASADVVSAGLLSVWLSRGPFAALWSGGAVGADSLCAAWAAAEGLPVRVWPAEWSLGRSAGVRRSAEMLAAAPPGSVVACFVPACGLAACAGSAFTVRSALARGLSVCLSVGSAPGVWVGGAEALLF